MNQYINFLFINKKLEAKLPKHKVGYNPCTKKKKCLQYIYNIQLAISKKYLNRIIIEDSF